MPAAPGSLARKTKREERTDGDPSHRQSSSKKPFSSRSSSSRSAGRDDGDSGGGKSAVRDDDADGDGGGGGGETVSMSVAETNKIRISLGLAPLEETPADGGEEKFTDTGERIMMDTDTNSEFVHKPADSWTAKKEQEKLREKLESAKSKREALNKLASVRTLSTPANEAEDDAAQWVNMMRSKEEQKRQAEQRAKMLDTMDEEFGVSNLIADEKHKARHAHRPKKEPKTGASKSSTLAGMQVEHSTDALMEADGDTILVLKDKGVLDEVTEETLVNPTMIEMERWTYASEMRKKKPNYHPYEEEVDEWGKVKAAKLLAQYDDEYEKQQKHVFRLDQSGGVRVSEDREAAMIREKLRLAQEHSLESKGYTLANEYYTPEEMIAAATFKKKKQKAGKLRGGKRLKADDLLDERAPPVLGSDVGSRETGPRDGKFFKDEQPRVGDDESKSTHIIKSASGAIVDKSKLLQLNATNESDDDSDADYTENVWSRDNIVIDDHDDAEQELQQQLSRARRQAMAKVEADVKKEDEKPAAPLRGAEKVHMMLATIKDEPMEEASSVQDGSGAPSTGLIMDSVAEYTRHLGDQALKEEEERAADHLKEMIKNPPRLSDDEMDNEDLEDRVVVHRDRKKPGARGTIATVVTQKGKWVEHLKEDEVQIDDDPSKHKQSSSAKRSRRDKKSSRRDEKDDKKRSRRRSRSKSAEEEEEEGADQILGNKEASMTVGVAGALRLARAKGYLEPAGLDKEDETKVVKLKHLTSQKFQEDKYGGSSHDIEDKYQKKLESIQNRGGPARPFEEKRHYDPNVHITYTDALGNHLDQREAWRQLCWKFHGRFPSKRQVEKKMRQADQKQHMTQMNSLDTPLGTLSKQTETQERMQQPYIVLSGKNAADVGTSLSKR